jgi:hypothetical protein
MLRWLTEKLNPVRVPLQLMPFDVNGDALHDIDAVTTLTAVTSDNGRLIPNGASGTVVSVYPATVYVEFYIDGEWHLADLPSNKVRLCPRSTKSDGA